MTTPRPLWLLASCLAGLPAQAATADEEASRTDAATLDRIVVTSTRLEGVRAFNEKRKPDFRKYQK